MKKYFTRRDFHKSALSLPTFSLAGVGATTLAETNPIKPHFFINIMCKGGMDATLSFDPKIHHNTNQKDIFIEYRADEIIGPKNAKLGPGASSLVNHIDDLCIFNGIVMREPAAHDLQKLNISSGKGDTQCPNYCAEISYLRNNATPILTKGPIALGHRNIELISFGSFKRGLQSESSDNKNNLNLVVKKAFSQLGGVRPAQINYFKYLQSLLYAKNLVKQFSLDINNDNHVMAVALASGAVTTINYFMDEEFDTHADHVKNHINLQKKSLGQVADLISTLKKIPFGDSSIFDNTTMAVVTEFSRTPYINDKEIMGKDHNFMTNSVILAGKGIKGSQSVGSSFTAPASERDEKVGVHIGNFYDYKNSKSISAENLSSTDDVKRNELSFIFPENFAATIYKNFDISLKQTQIDQTAKFVSQALKI